MYFCPWRNNFLESVVSLVLFLFVGFFFVTLLNFRSNVTCSSYNEKKTKTPKTQNNKTQNPKPTHTHTHTRDTRTRDGIGEIGAATPLQTAKDNQRKY